MMSRCFSNVQLIQIFTLSILSHSFAQTQNDYDVIIMGAGATGIGAAERLYAQNITNILIIEAQDYIGGRTRAVNFSNIGFNIGASWISGACNYSSINNISNCSNYTENPMLTAAYKYNYSFVNSDYTDAVILDFGGNQHNKTNTNKRYAKFYEALDCVSNIIDNVTNSYAFHNSPDDQSYQALLRLCGWSVPRTSIDRTVQWVNFEFEGPYAKWSSGLQQYINDNNMDTFETYGPDNLFITDPRGYQGILLSIVDEFLDINDESKIILNSPITTIQYDDTGVTVTLENGTDYSANYGILTFSVGVLQSDIVEFVPQLPAWKMESILAFDYIDYTPILVKWPHNFWSDKINMSDPASEFILFNDDRFGYFPWIYNFDHPNLWNGSLIWRFDLSLDIAQYVQYENINDTIKQIIQLKLSHYFDEVPEPEDIIVAQWHVNRYTQGSYSNWPAGFTEEQKQAMGWPLKQTLFFSGEAYCDFDYAFVHSAYLSGNNTVYEILACMGNDMALLNGFECPSEYVPPSDGSDCGSVSESVFKEFAWLWIVLGSLLGVVAGYLLAVYWKRRSDHKIESIERVVDSNYGAAADLPMVTQTTD